MTNADEATGWSTTELAEIARTTVKAIRHYHRSGLLPEPRRRANGFKAYGSEHLARLLDIVWMREVGFTVSQIGEWLLADGPSPHGSRQLLAQVDASIRRLEAVRADLLASIERAGEERQPADGVAGPSDGERLAQRVMSRHFTPDAMAAVRSMDAAPASPVDAEFAQLPPDASADAIQDLATRMAPLLRREHARHPMPEQVVDGGGADGRQAVRALGRVLAEAYNPAQLAVVRRALDRLDADAARTSAHDEDERA